MKDRRRPDKAPLRPVRLDLRSQRTEFLVELTDSEIEVNALQDASAT